ncbi:MAG: TonB-dependent receptor, partial [Pseudomonadota bacterium]|nr:TonB-dependent receptor [Pseudomonadota bacterium]
MFINQRISTSVLIGLGLICTSHSLADTTKDTELNTVTIIGTDEDLSTLAGSATRIDETMISEFDSTDLNDLLTRTPGVYIRYEDGYGLRPNIGIRGVTSDRSQKITLMEDGVLISPAPYTAPAAYYIPNVNRMQNVEVVKGPAAIQHGPHTIGGAINMITRPAPYEAEGSLDLTYGSDNYHKGRVQFGDTPDSLGGQWGYHLDLMSYGADGFKELDNGEDTGFVRNDVNAKLQWESHPSAEYAQRATLKLGYADETSDETYLGLTDDDFKATPNRRYAASQLDQFNSDHTQVHFLHDIELSPTLSLSTKVYQQTFNRSWNKFDGFIDGVSAQDVLANPDIFVTEMSALRGDISEANSQDVTIDVTNNDRTYGSHGLSLSGEYLTDTGDIEHTLRAGVRYHHDYVERHHTQKGYYMVNGTLEFDGVDDRDPKTLNEASSDAIAVFINDEMIIDDWAINLGVRYETIDGEVTNKLTDTRTTRSQSILAPGAGAYYQLTPELGVLAGVYKGFSPAGPASDDSVSPEESINYEYGVRYRKDELSADAIGFFSDYSNLIGRCRASDSGCTVGDEFNGGKVQVAGMEFTLNHAMSWDRYRFPIEVVYTYTESAFQSSFQSGFSQWGVVDAGDELPYLPKHQARLS